MRITFGLALMTSVCLLAGCNKGAGNNSAANAPAPAANAAAPAPSAPAETPAPANAASADRRANEIGECVSGAPEHLPAGTDANAFCSCAVDKMMGSGTSQTDAVNQCAAEMHITLTNPE